MKKALIVGGSNGIGLALSSLLIEKGYFIDILDINPGDINLLPAGMYSYTFCNLLYLDENLISSKANDKDIDLLLDAIWNGTKNLITRSKFGQTPRLLLQIEYSEDYFFIGDLNNKISIQHELNSDKEIRRITDFKIDITNLLDTLKKSKDKISKVYYKLDDNLMFTNGDIIEQIISLDIECEELEL